jgi:hypothetical protein
MFFDRYTEDARRAVAMAKEEAASIGSPHIEAEHLLSEYRVQSGQKLNFCGSKSLRTHFALTSEQTHNSSHVRRQPIYRFQIPVREFWPMLLKRLFDSTHRVLAQDTCSLEFCVNPTVPPRVC